MSTTPDPVDQSNNASGDADNKETKDKDSVQYSSYQKVLGEKKKMQAEKDDLLNKLKDFEQRDLELKGKDKELIDTLRKESKEKEEKLSSVVQKFAMKQIESQLSAEAAKHGCVDPDALSKFIDVKSLEFDPENFAVNKDDLKREMEKVVKDKPYLFKKPAPKINDLPLTNNRAENKPVSVYDLSKEDLIKAWKSLK